MERQEFLQKHGPFIHALVNNPGMLAAVEFVAQTEIDIVLANLQALTIAGNHHAAAISAGKIEGIKDFLAILKGVARDYGEAKTSLSH